MTHTKTSKKPKECGKCGDEIIELDSIERDFCEDCGMECPECGAFESRDEFRKGKCFMCRETSL